MLELILIVWHGLPTGSASRSLLLSMTTLLVCLKINGLAVVFTMASDGSELTRISDAASGPAWSPDGRRIAVVVPVGKAEFDRGSTGPRRRDVGVALYAFAADGSDPVLVSNSLREPWRRPVDPWMGDLSWSPDGSQILLKNLAYRVPLDGSPLLMLAQQIQGLVLWRRPTLWMRPGLPTAPRSR